MRVGFGRALVTVLVGLAVCFNIVGATLFAQAFRDAVAAGMPVVDAAICHSGGEEPADRGGVPPLKCPLCLVSSSGLSAPPAQPPAVPVPVVADRAWPLPAEPGSWGISIVVRPRPRGPPLSA